MTCKISHILRIQILTSPRTINRKRNRNCEALPPLHSHTIVSIVIVHFAQRVLHRIREASAKRYRIFSLGFDESTVQSMRLTIRGLRRKC